MRSITDNSVRVRRLILDRSLFILFSFLFFTFTFLGFQPSRAFAQERDSAKEGMDFAATLLARTYSPALSINPNIGYGIKLWGDISTPWYGFVRPSIYGVLSPSLYEGKVGIEIFPVSILGIDIKRTSSRRFSETKGQDCTQVQCQGVLDYTDVSFQSYLGHAGYFSSIRWTRTFFDAISDLSKPIYDLGTSILLKPGGDIGDFLTIAAGKELDSGISIGLLLQTADFRYSGQHQEGQYAIVKSNLKSIGWDDFDATVGVGRFKTDLNVAEASVILQVTYTHTRAIGFGR